MTKHNKNRSSPTSKKTDRLKLNVKIMLLVFFVYKEVVQTINPFYDHEVLIGLSEKVRRKKSELWCSDDCVTTILLLVLHLLISTFAQ